MWECNVRINEFGHRGRVEEAKKLDAVSLLALQKYFCRICNDTRIREGPSLPEACRLFNDMVDRNAFSWTSLISGYSAIGQVEEGRLLFEQMPDSLKNVVSWTTFVLGYARNGLINEAMLKSYVDNDQIDDAFSRAGLAEKEKKLFDSIHAFGLQPKAKHYSCLVGILGRAGQLDKAMSVVKKMPPSKRDGTFLGALLAACRTHGAHEKWDEFAQVRKMMRERKLKKVASFSQVEVEGKNHVFFVGDRSHPQVEGIHEMPRLMHYHLLRPRFWFTRQSKFTDCRHLVMIDSVKLTVHKLHILHEMLPTYALPPSTTEVGYVR
ncbi:pentatricopeptide repeat-containing protein mitochondrial [Gossypium australe]|uniref:Pentatricopeptide repeat-containing protein mitochondrial n=1 Tax=Gossypium australe TaxID=47621 RepID=A0A5B6XBC0_9ROSI|nr:pentatricopeptide repeat-containing protein mitochondrial [Gossypium australe]